MLFFPLINSSSFSFLFLYFEPFFSPFVLSHVLSRCEAGRAEAWLGFEVFRPVTVQTTAFVSRLSAKAAKLQSDLYTILGTQVRCVEIFHNNIPEASLVDLCVCVC